MIPSDKRILQLVKKLSKKPMTKRKAQLIIDSDEHDTRIQSATADEIFREMKKLPFAD